MRRALHAELYLQVRRRTVVVVVFLVIGILAVLVGLRFATSAADTSAAVRAAIELAAELERQTGSPIDPASTYVEPRYVFAAQYPYDVAGVSLAIMLVVLVGGAVLAGGDWRTRAVGATFAGWRQRSTPATARILVTAVLSAGLALAALTVLSGLLLLTASVRGSSAGAELGAMALLVGRGALLGGLGGLVGAAFGTVLRSDVLVVVAVLAYVLVVETLLPVLLRSGWRTPGTRVLDFVVSSGPSRDLLPRCDVPRCEPVVVVGPGGAGSYLIVVGCALLLVAVGHRAARRPLWS